MPDRIDDSRRCERNGWSGVEIRHLTALAAIARQGSFRGAASSLGYVQSAVSQQIAQLERIVGIRLIERSRGPGPVALTEAGRVLLGHIDEIVWRLGAAQADLHAVSAGLLGGLRLGVHESVATRLLPALLDRFPANWPDLRLTTREASTDAELFDLVERGHLDAAFADLPLEPGPFTAIELLTDPYVLIVAADSDLGRRGTVRSLDEIESLRLIGRSDWRDRPRLAKALRASCRDADSVFRSDISATVQGLVRKDIGAAILPRLAVDEDDPAIRAIDVGDLAGHRTLVMFWHSERSHAAALSRLRGVVQEVCEELATSQSGVRLVAAVEQRRERE